MLKKESGTNVKSFFGDDAWMLVMNRSVNVVQIVQVDVELVPPPC
jgi:hypothetical protein